MSVCVEGKRGGIAAGPAISIVMAAYKGAGVIGETIDSVLAQSCTDWELVVVDDCSPDDTLDVLAAYTDPRIRVIAAAANGGPVAARNRAFAEARGRAIVGLDQDDLCHPDRFARQLAFLDAHPEVVLVASQVDYLQDGAIQPPRAPFVTTPALLAWRLLLGNPIVWSSVMFRADAARTLPVFERQERLYAEDYDLYHRLSRYGAIARIDEPLTTYRVHAGGMSKLFTTRMVESAAGVLAEHYQPIFGQEARDAALLVMRHLGTGDPAPDVVTLARLAGTLARVHEHFVATHAPSADDLALIMGEYARLWWRVADASVRSGQVSLPRAVAARPEGAALSAAYVARGSTSAVIGTYRAAARRLSA